MSDAEVTYQVIVGNIGTVYDGPNLQTAQQTFSHYKEASKSNSGRASGESVALFARADGMDDIIEEYTPEETQMSQHTPRPVNLSPTEATMQLVNGYDRTKHPETAEYRPMTIEEAKLLSYGDHPTIICNDGKARQVKVNGAPKTWKRDASRVEVPVKYGMYEYTTLCARADGTMELLVVKL